MLEYTYNPNAAEYVPQKKLSKIGIFLFSNSLLSILQHACYKIISKLSKFSTVSLSSGHPIGQWLRRDIGNDYLHFPQRSFTRRTQPAFWFTRTKYWSGYSKLESLGSSSSSKNSLCAAHRWAYSSGFGILHWLETNHIVTTPFTSTCQRYCNIKAWSQLLLLSDCQWSHSGTVRVNQRHLLPNLKGIKDITTYCLRSIHKLFTIYVIWSWNRSFQLLPPSQLQKLYSPEKDNWATRPINDRVL